MNSDSKEDAEHPRRRKRDMLQSYYGGDSTAATSANNPFGQLVDDPCDIDSKLFNPKLYLDQLVKQKSLTELMDKETEMTSAIRSLDSSMQTLVYENYNKFIGATDTIRKMKNDFKTMEDEMDALTQNMDNIVSFSGRITATLGERRAKITELHGVSALLKKLQYLFDLPAKLQSCLETGDFAVAVRSYVNTQAVINRYKDMPSFKGIYEDCEKIVKDLKEKLKSKFRDRECTAHQLSECVDLLLQLKEPPEGLYQEYLTHAQKKLEEDIQELRQQTEVKRKHAIEQNSGTKDIPIDILEFVDIGCNKFLSNMCLVIAAYSDMFLHKDMANREAMELVALKMLNQFAYELMHQYFSCIEERLRLEEKTSDSALLVRALDRFNRRLQAMNKLLPSTDFARAGNDIVLKISQDRVAQYLDVLKQQFSDSLTDVRQSLASPKLLGKSVDDGKLSLSDLLNTLNSAVVNHVTSALSHLQCFIESGLTFSAKSYFRNAFCIDVRKLLVNYLEHLWQTSKDYCETVSVSAPPLLLILARFSSDMGHSTAMYLLAHADELFIAETSQVTPIGALCEKFKDVGQRLLNHYVRVQGQIISQLLRKSVETRDWLNTIEPRTVRAVMKRVIEDVTVIDTFVGQLFEEGTKKERSSDSSRRTLNYSSASKHPSRANWTYASSVNSNLMSNIQKLFSEKIEIFTAIEFNKVSILTGVIKISLKTFLECVRLRSFGTYGLQQIQVDTHYLQLYLWRFVSDENIVHSLLDEIVNSAVHRCVNPVLMEPSVVELVCEQG